MWRRIALVAIIAGGYAVAMYTSTGCGPYESSTSPTAFGTLLGTVTDARTGAPLAGVEVAIRSKSSGVTIPTDNAGRYNIPVEAGQVEVTATKSGYQTFRQTVNVAANASVVLDIKLQPST